MESPKSCQGQNPQRLEPHHPHGLAVTSMCSSIPFKSQQDQGCQVGLNPGFRTVMGETKPGFFLKCAAMRWKIQIFALPSASVSSGLSRGKRRLAPSKTENIYENEFRVQVQANSGSGLIKGKVRRDRAVVPQGDPCSARLPQMNSCLGHTELAGGSNLSSNSQP